MDFTSLGVSEHLIAALAKRGITAPTEIQAGFIPAARAGENLIGEAPTGTGKTLAYLLPAMERIDPSVRTAQALVLAPTHELAMQIAAMNPRYATEADIPTEEYERVKAEKLAAIEAEGKPAEMAAKIVEGQLKKHFAEQVLMAQAYILDDSHTVEEHIKAAVAKLGENIVVGQFKRIELGVSE